MPRVRLHQVLFAVSALLLAIAARAQSPNPVPTTDPAQGRLSIHAIQGAEGAPPPAGDRVRVELFRDDKAIGSLDAILDAQGSVVLDGIRLGDGITPVISIEHAGATYRKAGPPMTDDHPVATIDIVVYESTTLEPAWRVASRQVMVTPDEGRVIISESVLVTNPSDRTWTGGEPAPNGKRTTLRFTLPAGAEDILLDAGFQGWDSATVQGDTLAAQTPLIPGETVYRYSYLLAMDSGRVVLPFSSAAPTDEIAVFVPDRAFRITPDGLNALSAQETEQGTLRLYYAGSVPALTTVSLQIDSAAGDPPTPATADTPPSTGPTTASTAVVTAIVVAAILGVMALIHWRSRAPERARSAEPKP